MKSKFCFKGFYLPVDVCKRKSSREYLILKYHAVSIELNWEGMDYPHTKPHQKNPSIPKPIFGGSLQNKSRIR